MSQDSKVISYLSAPELSALMNATGAIAVDATTTAESRPVIQAHLKITDHRTGEEIPGGLPFAVVMFKGEREPGCSNIAVAARIPVGALGIRLPANYFNLCNEQYRFVRVFPLGHDSIALQMDIYLHAATREYVKFAFGIWATAFSQVLYDLMSQRGQMAAPQDAVVDVAQHTAVVESGTVESILPPDLGGELAEARQPEQPAVAIFDEPAVEAAAHQDDGVVLEDEGVMLAPEDAPHAEAVLTPHDDEVIQVDDVIAGLGDVPQHAPSETPAP